MGGGRYDTFNKRRPFWMEVKVQNELLFRILVGILLGVVLSISGTFRHRADKAGGKVSLREDGPAISIFIIVARILMLAVILSQLFRPQWIQWATLALPTWLRWLGAGIGVAAIPLLYWVMSSLGKNVTPTSATRKDASLVTSGPYRWVRHPLYSVGCRVPGGHEPAHGELAFCGVLRFGIPHDARAHADGGEAADRKVRR